MNVLLALPPNLERRFWQHQTRQLQWVDVVGTAFYVSINTISIAFLRLPSRYTLFMSLTVVLQLLQLAWCLLRPWSYVRWRLPIVLLHRLRWMVMVAHCCYYLSLDQVMLFIGGNLAQNAAGSVRAFIAVTTYMPALALGQSLNNMVPFKHAAWVSEATLAIYMCLALPHQVHALQEYDLQRFVQPACQAMHSLVLTPFTSVRPQPSGMGRFSTCCSSPAAAPLLLSWLYAVIAVLLPLQFQHLTEHRAKVAFLRSTLQVAVGPQPYSSPWMCIAYSWAACAIAWVLLSLHCC